MTVNGGKTRFRRPWRAHEKHPCFSMVSPPFTGIPSSYLVLYVLLLKRLKETAIRAIVAIT